MSDTPPPAAGHPPGLSPADAVPAGGQPGPLAGDPGAAPLPTGGYDGAGWGPVVPSRRRGPRPRTRWRTAFFLLAALATVAAVVWALLGGRLFVVRSITVTGTHLVSSAQVIAAADVPAGTPLVTVDAGSVTRRVEAIRQVASATVTENWPDGLVIVVTERVPVMAVRMAAGGYDLVDPSGVIVSYAADKPAALPVLVTALSGAALRGSPQVASVAGVLAGLQPWLAGQVVKAGATKVATGTQEVSLVLRDGKTVKWGTPGDAAQKNRELKILLPGNGRVIDVSSPGTVVVTGLFFPRPAPEDAVLTGHSGTKPGSGHACAGISMMWAATRAHRPRG